MLYIVLVLVVVAFGLLISSLATSFTVFAWISLGVSVLAAIVLFAEWVTRRQAAGAGGMAPGTAGESEEGAPEGAQKSAQEGAQPTAAESALPVAVSGGPSGSATEGAAKGFAENSVGGFAEDGAADDTGNIPAKMAGTIAGDTASRVDNASTGGAEDEDAEDELVPDREPDEEDTDAADLLVVSGSEVEVRVLNEHPRYHLDRCRWLGGRPTLVLSVRQARGLGFSPCAVCTPDAVIAARHRQSQPEPVRKDQSQQDTQGSETQSSETQSSDT